MSAVREPLPSCCVPNQQQDTRWEATIPCAGPGKCPRCRQEYASQWDTAQTALHLSTRRVGPARRPTNTRNAVTRVMSAHARSTSLHWHYQVSWTAPCIACFPTYAYTHSRPSTRIEATSGACTPMPHAGTATSQLARQRPTALLTQATHNRPRGAAQASLHADPLKQNVVAARTPRSVVCSQVDWGPAHSPARPTPVPCSS